MSQPAFTNIERQEPIALVSIDEARQWVGLYGDTSLDAELKICLDSAIESISNWLGVAVSNAEITDKYVGGTREFTPSQKGINLSTITLAFYNTSGAMQVVSSTNYTIDPTAKVPCVVLDEDYLPIYHASYAYPWSLAYTNDFSKIAGFPAINSVKLAVRVMTSKLWMHRGDSDMNTYGYDRLLSQVLGPAKDSDWYSRLQG